MDGACSALPCVECCVRGVAVYQKSGAARIRARPTFGEGRRLLLRAVWWCSRTCNEGLQEAEA